MSQMLQGVSERLQRHIDVTWESGPVSQDVLLAGAEAVQEQYWWFRP